jgi:Leucine-rich repeat (LRR) protein
MVKNYKDYIKEHLDIDPFDEEDWELDNLSPLLQLVRKQYDNKPYDEIISLDCICSRLFSLDGIENLVNLKELYCGYNQLTSLDGIENLVNLERLYCGMNDFSEDYKNYLKNYCENKNIYLII